MINSYKGLTGRYLKANKKRSILTIIGIALSVALIASIGFFLKGIQTAQIENYKGTYGSWHVKFKTVTSDMLSTIVNNPKVSRSGLLQLGADIKLDKDVTLAPTIASDKALELLPYRLKEGRLPNNKKEIAIEKWTSNYIKKGLKIGDTLTLENTKYTLVGFLQDLHQTQVKNSGILLSKNNDINIKDASLLVEISSKTNLKKAVNELDSLSNESNTINNIPVIDLEGGGNDATSKAMNTIVGVIIAIIMIATVAVIYNSFQISVVERVKQFGLLRAVGMTPRQLKNMILREASILSVIAIPIGLACGIIAIYSIKLAFKLIGADTIMPLDISISPDVLLISTAVGIVSVFFSALLPAFFASRISPLVAISSQTSITKEKIKRRKNILIKNFLGFEGDLASKNIKRNKKRYRITVFSIVISVVLFITFKSFMDMTLNMNGTINERDKNHFSVYQTGNNSSSDYIDDNTIDSISKLDTVSNVTKYYTPCYFKQYIDKNKKINMLAHYEGFDKTEILNGKEKAVFDDGLVSIYDNSSIQKAKKYLTAGNIDISKLNSENGVILINKNVIEDEKLHKKYSGPVANIKVGDEIDLQYIDINNQKHSLKKVKVLAILSDDPYSYSQNKGLHFITTEDVAKNLTDLTSFRPSSLGIEIKDLKLENNAKSEIEKVLQETPSLRLINNIDSHRKEKTSILMVQILIYGFVIVISLISSINIINTLTTNIMLRKREFAALKSIGLTQKGLRKMITLEGLLYGIQGTIIGSIIATGFSYFLYKRMLGVQDFEWNAPWAAIAIAGVSALLISFLSVLSPLRRINKENIIETIREDA